MELQCTLNATPAAGFIKWYVTMEIARISKQASLGVWVPDQKKKKEQLMHENVSNKYLELS